MEKLSTNEVIEWAKQFLAKADSELSSEERKEQEKYAILIQNPNDKILLSKLLDESSQIRDNKKLAVRMKILIEKYGIPKFFSATDTVLLRLFTLIGYRFHFIAVPVFKKRLRNDTSKVIINEKPSLLNKHLQQRETQQIGQNVNLLGEVVLGDAEANHRYKHYLEALTDPRINYISIKISGIYAQINPLNYEKNKVDLCERLATIYRQAIKYPFVDEKGNKSTKFVNLDMEEYKDTELTFDVFTSVLSQPEFLNYRAGIVVQAYLPDALSFQQRLLDFARARVEAGGEPLKMRLVKGANLQMETIVSSLKGWENPVYDDKVKVDANYLRILDKALQPENAKVLNIGVASHNFFSISYAHLLSKKYGVEDFVTFEMLEGMANHLPRVMRSLEKHIILYTPVVKDEHFLNAVSYLVRRLDENTGKENFLSYSFNLKVDSKQWNFLKEQFLEAYALKETLPSEIKRTQNRNEEKPNPNYRLDEFRNEPDTDFDLIQNRLWAEKIFKNWDKTSKDTPVEIPVQIGSKQIETGNKYSYSDRSKTEDVISYKASLANTDQVNEMIALAEKDASGWRESSLEKRIDVLHRTADNLRLKRGDLIGCMAVVTGKTFNEGDVEVSEAIDFCHYYPLSMETFSSLKTVELSPKGIILVIPPWNFPLAIPVGGVAAALSGGNSVILKPATVAYPVAWEFAQCFWDAGVPKDALQVVCTDGREPQNYLSAHPSVRHIILTGGTDTAFRLLENNPTCPLSAETGGKNAIILTAAGDRDHAIQNIVTSAFGNAGQKCSACSLLILEKEIYEDDEFKVKLRDAVSSMHTGSVWDGGNKVGPMITNKNDKLIRAIENLEAGEFWLVAPEYVDKEQYILKPCVKWGVKEGSYTFRTELFAPLLAVVCAEDFEDALRLANLTEYGLTSGLQSLDEKEIEKWRNTMEAGNLYINRGITGAIVHRQPFGGMKRSAFGGGIKAGGPNYVSCFVDIKEKENIPAVKSEIKVPTEYYTYASESDMERIKIGLKSYRDNWYNVFSKEKDVSHIVGEENTFRYLPLKNMAFRVFELDSLADIMLVASAAERTKTSLIISVSPNDKRLDTLKKIFGEKIVVDTDAEFIANMDDYERIRTCSDNIPTDYYLQAAKLGKYIAMLAPVTEGRIELLHYLKEQSISYEYHRYGSITDYHPENVR